jgi:hypothetical protein
MPTVIAPGSSQTEISSAELTLILEGLAPLSSRRRRTSDEEVVEAAGPIEKNKSEPIVH